MQLDENGKPCKACDTLTDFQNSLFTPSPRAPHQMPQPEPDAYRQEPPNSGQLGRSTWTYLHSLAAYYPQSPSIEQQQQAKQLVTVFANFYPCKPCARDFQEYIKTHEVDTTSREKFSLWMCDAHNAVNTKLGKPSFDCRYWSQRWRDGWEELMNKK